MCVFIPGPWDGLKGTPQETRQCVAVVTKQYSPPLSFLPAPPLPLHHTHSPSSSQALNLLASPRARRGVRVGSICPSDGHWCQAPRGLEAEERRLVWSGRLTDVSELSSGAEAGGKERGRG